MTASAPAVMRARRSAVSGMARSMKARPAMRSAACSGFPDEAAEHEHQSTPWFTEIVPQMIPCFDGPYVREYFHPLTASAKGLTA